MIAQTLKWVGGIEGFLELIDQRLLPGEFVKLQCRNIEQLYEAIKTLAVRGAPAIGVSAAYGLVLGMQTTSSHPQGHSAELSRSPALEAATNKQKLERGLTVLADSSDYLAATRPTAVNLSWALDLSLIHISEPTRPY